MISWKVEIFLLVDKLKSWKIDNLWQVGKFKSWKNDKLWQVGRWKLTNQGRDYVAHSVLGVEEQLAAGL